MAERTIATTSPLGKHLDQINGTKQASYLMLGNRKIDLVAQITIGRESDNDVVVESKLVSRHHCMIQKIRDAYFLKDSGSTNGTFLNGTKIPLDKYVRLNIGDKISIGSVNLVIA